MLLARSPERDFKPAHAVDRLVEHIGNLGLTYELKKHGDDVFPIYKAQIYDHRNQTKWIGGGKGLDQQCVASAIAECIQHRTAFNAVSEYDDGQVPLLRVAQILGAQKSRKLGKYSDIFERNGPTEYSALPYVSISDESDSIYYPVALTEPRYNKLPNADIAQADSLLWRSHDTGSSFGLTYDEALLHGITEWIEKHTFSLFLLATYFEAGSDAEVTHISKESLPSYLLEVIRHIETQFDDNLSIITLNNDFDIPCILTVFNRQQDCVVQPKGLACSLHKQYAIEKSVFEALQCRLLRNANTENKERQILRNFAEYPLFLPAFLLAMSDKTNTTAAYQELPLYDDLNLANQISTISERLERSGGYTIYRHIYKREPGGLTSPNVLIPGFNENFLIKEGKFVVDRGQARKGLT